MISKTKFHTLPPLLLLFIYVIVSGWEKEIDIERIDLATLDSRTHEAIETAGILVNAPDLEKYLYSTLHAISGSLPGTVPPYRLRIIKSSELNAFSLSDGTIYISLGLFGLIENEAQLAMLLAHEISHVKLDHHRRFRYELHKQTSKNFIFGSNSPYNLRTALSGFSMTQENAADSAALMMITKHGYNGWSGKNLLRTMYVWLKYKEKSYNKATATHPTLSTRLTKCIRILQNDHIDSTSGTVGDNTYQDAISSHLPIIIDLLRQSNSFNELYAMANSKILMDNTVADWHYLKGSLMERFHPVDSFYIASKELKTALRIDPSFTIGLRDLGWLYLKNMMYDSARVCLSQYLMHTPHAHDSSLIMYYLESNK